MKRICLLILVVGLCHDVSNATDCTSRGRFPNNDEPDCRGYTMCLPTGAAFMQYKLTCPLGSVYSHIEQQCTTATTYQCFENYTCNVTGNFEDLMSDNCTTFVACVMGLNGFVTARRVDCSGSQLFRPGDGVCVNETEFSCLPFVETTTASFEVTEFNTVASENDNGFQFSSEMPMNSVRGVHSNAFLIIMLIFCFIKCI